jgi:hypothetical protein
MLIEANKIPKNNLIWKYSNPKTSQRRAFHFFGKNAVIYKSTKKNKKYMIQKDGTFIHFGQIPYEDFTKHKNTKRRKNYLNRSSKIRGDWRKHKYSPNNLARKILW